MDINWYKTEMTSNNSPVPLVASATSEYSATYSACKAFSNSKEANSAWASAVGEITPSIQIDYGIKKKVNVLYLRDRAMSLVDMPIEFEVQGSNNGVSFETIQLFQTADTWAINEERIFYFDKSVDYRIYKINITQAGGSQPYVCIGEIMFGYTFKNKMVVKSDTDKNYSLLDKTLLILPNSEKTTILEYGINPKREIILDEDFNSVVHIESEKETLENGSLFTHRNIETQKIKLIEDNYSNTLDPSNMGAGIEISDDLLSVSLAPSASVRATNGLRVGKWYWEVTLDSASVIAHMIGISSKSLSMNGFIHGGLSRLYYANSGNTYPLNLKYGSALKVGDTLGLALDLDNGTLTYYKNGLSLGVAFDDILDLGEVYPSLSTGSSGKFDNVTSINFGAKDFKHPIPSGFKPYDSSPLPKRAFVVNDGRYMYFEETWKNIDSDIPATQDFLDYGMVKLSTIPSTSWKELDEVVNIVIYNENTSQEFSSITIETENPFSVYNYISENPVVLILSDEEKESIVETKTELYTLQEEFKDSVNVIYHTDYTNITKADLVIEGSKSPLDELDGEFEVLTWTDNPIEGAQMTLGLTALPKPQFIKLVSAKRVYGALNSLLLNDISEGQRNDTRFLLTDKMANVWYRWNKYTKDFVEVTDVHSNELILKHGMKFEEINSITEEDWNKWSKGYINIGIFLNENVEKTIVSKVESISYKDLLPRYTSLVEKGNFYILNTTAKIELEMIGNTVKGLLSDSDLTRVQYRILINNQYHYPTDGTFTKLSDSPNNIDITIQSKDIKIGDWNTVKVEFQDFYGTTDYWQTQFIGTYSGLMFKDIHGDFYTSEIGEVLKYLDFGIIIAGQTTIEHEIILKNQYGYDVENLYLYANSSGFPTGMTFEFSESLSPFIPQSELRFARTLANDEELTFFVRIRTELGSTPDANGSFDIIVRADKVD